MANSIGNWQIPIEISVAFGKNGSKPSVNCFKFLLSKDSDNFLLEGQQQHISWIKVSRSLNVILVEFLNLT